MKRSYKRSEGGVYRLYGEKVVTERVCLWEGCGTVLHPSHKDKYCYTHRRKLRDQAQEVIK